MDKKNKSLVDIIKDLMEHPNDDLGYLDKGLLSRPEFKSADLAHLKSALSKIINNKALSESEKKSYLLDSWKINFKVKPPSITEFLTNEWLGPVADSLFPYLKDILVNYFNPLSPYRDLILYTPIGWGKSFCAILVNLFIAVHYNLMRNPKKYLGINVSTLIVLGLIAFNRDKAYEILAKPLINMVSVSDKFVRCQTEEQLEKKQKEYGTSKFCFTTAGTGSVLRLGSLYFKQISDTSDLLGLSFLAATATELTFFQEKGWADTKILKMYNDMKGRVFSRFGRNYYARTILDSSPNSLESSIDNFIVNKSQTFPTNYLVRGTKWFYQPWLYPEWEADNNLTFPVYKGDGSTQPKLLTSSELENYDTTDIIDFPVDLHDLAKNDLPNTLKNYAGEPTIEDEKLIKNMDLIDNIFQDHLINEYTFIHVPHHLPPEDLIWDKVKETYFLKVGDKYQFYRNPSAVRYLSVDQSEVNDWTGIAMSHAEMTSKGKIIYVTDFSIAIAPTNKSKINLEAIKFFIHDLRRKGGVILSKVSFDQFQSSSTRQYLERYDFDVVKESVDISTEPYLNYISAMSRGEVKMGRSLVMKNNLKSLVMGATKIKKKKKIDHRSGEVVVDINDQDWNHSKMGYYMKDLSDAVVASVYLTEKYGNKAPQFIWRDVDKDEVTFYDTIKDKMKEDIHKLYGLQIIGG